VALAVSLAAMDLLGRQKLVDSMQASVLQAGEARVMASYPIQENNLAGGFPFREGQCTFEDFLQEIEDGRKPTYLTESSTWLLRTTQMQPTSPPGLP